MTSVYLWSGIGSFLLLCGVLIYARPRGGRHELERGNELEWLPATLAPLPVPEQLREPRAIPDVPPAAAQLSEPPSATCGKWRCMVDSLVAASWQSHLTMQRTYDILAFATVVVALDRHEVSYA